MLAYVYEWHLLKFCMLYQILWGQGYSGLNPTEIQKSADGKDLSPVPSTACCLFCKSHQRIRGPHERFSTVCRAAVRKRESNETSFAKEGSCLAKEVVSHFLSLLSATLCMAHFILETNLPQPSVCVFRVEEGKEIPSLSAASPSFSTAAQFTVSVAFKMQTLIYFIYNTYVRPFCPH